MIEISQSNTRLLPMNFLAIEDTTAATCSLGHIESQLANQTTQPGDYLVPSIKMLTQPPS